MRNTRTYLLSMTIFWLVFGLITTFAPSMMDMFQTPEGIAAKTPFSNHVWTHDGLDIIAFCIILFALSRERVSRGVLRAAALGALMPTIGIFYSLATTPYWSPLFIASGIGCLVFVIWGVSLASKPGTEAASIATAS